MPAYIVTDRHTGYQATRTQYASRKAADRAVDRLDNQYGGYRYSVRKLAIDGDYVAQWGGLEYITDSHADLIAWVGRVLLNNPELRGQPLAIARIGSDEPAAVLNAQALAI